MVFVDEWAGPSPLEATLHAWVVPASDSGNLQVSPAEQDVTLAGEFSLDLAWSGLTEGSRYLGTVEYAADGASVDSTVVSVDT